MTAIRVLSYVVRYANRDDHHDAWHDRRDAVGRRRPLPPPGRRRVSGAAARSTARPARAPLGVRVRRARPGSGRRGRELPDRGPDRSLGGRRRRHVLALRDAERTVDRLGCGLPADRDVGASPGDRWRRRPPRRQHALRPRQRTPAANRRDCSASDSPGRSGTGRRRVRRDDPRRTRRRLQLHVGIRPASDPRRRRSDGGGGHSADRRLRDRAPRRGHGSRPPTRARDEPHRFFRLIDGRRIDHALVSPEVGAEAFATLTDRDDRGRYPSDHLPVLARDWPYKEPAAITTTRPRTPSPSRSRAWPSRTSREGHRSVSHSRRCEGRCSTGRRSLRPCSSPVAPRIGLSGPLACRRQPRGPPRARVDQPLGQRGLTVGVRLVGGRDVVYHVPARQEVARDGVVLADDVAVPVVALLAGERERPSASASTCGAGADFPVGVLGRDSSASSTASPSPKYAIPFRPNSTLTSD